jgi:hypothetical protein
LRRKPTVLSIKEKNMRKLTSFEWFLLSIPVGAIIGYIISEFF